MSDLRSPDPLPVTPVAGPLDAVVRLPGSKSITNRALVCAALATGRSTLENVLLADDTEAMLDCLDRLGFEVEVDREQARVLVEGAGGRIPAAHADLDARQSGTTARFLLPVLALGDGEYRLDGHPQLRARPMGVMIDTLRTLGADIREHGAPGSLPVTVAGQGGLQGGLVRVPATVSSQFLSGLLMAGPYLLGGLQLEAVGERVSQPYLGLTALVMGDFGVAPRESSVPEQPYQAAHLTIEPDASTASYVAAAAAICGGRVRIHGLDDRSAQGDVGFFSVLGQMGADVRYSDGTTTVTGAVALHGGEFDFRDISDAAPTLAAVAAFAETTTRVTGIGFIRRKETDRIAAVVTELRRCGVGAEEEPDGFVVHPAAPRQARVETYKDHRMAMSFALIGLRVPGIEIVDPDCVAKTFPGYWDLLDELRASSASPDRVPRP